MDKHEHEELERLRREVATLRLVNRTWEILAELGKERYAIDLKKNFEATLSAELARSTAAAEGKSPEERRTAGRSATARRRTTGASAAAAGRSVRPSSCPWWRISVRTCRVLAG